MNEMNGLTEDQVCANFALVSTAYSKGVEDAAKVCEQKTQKFLSPEYATGQPLSSLQERFACGQCTSAIRALKEGPHG